MDKIVETFIVYLHNTKKTSNNTEVSYRRDLKKVINYFQKKGISEITEVTELDLEGYMMEMELKHFASSTISRSVASIHALFHYLFKEGIIKNDPSENLRSPKVEKKIPEILSIEEVDKLLMQPAHDTPKGMRDKAMLELLYTTGIRVTELIILKISDVNLETGIITCTDAPSKRVIPLPETTKVILKRYLEQGRKSLIKDESTQWLFTNCSGKSMSRQGFWKLIKSYGKKAQIDTELTPHILRQSFTERLTS